MTDIINMLSYWAITLVILVSSGLATIWIDLGDFWKGYVLDMAGPAWAYILFRGLYTKKTDNIWTRIFTPENNPCPVFNGEWGN